MKKNTKLKVSPREFFKGLMEKAKEDSILDIYKAYGWQVGNCKGHRYYVECDNCGAKIEDKKANISTKHNGFKCYGCGTQLSNIDCVMEKRNLTFKNAILNIAEVRRLDGYEQIPEYNRVTKNNSGETITVSAPIERVELPVVPEKKIASNDILDKVLKEYCRGYSIIEGRAKLSKEHLDYLKNRNLDEDDIKEGGYFTLPSSNMVAYIIKSLKEKYNIDESSLENIPGFYRNSSGKITFKHYSAIGIPIINAKRLYKGVQIRLNKEICYTTSKGKVKKLRYIWLSSDDIPEGCTGGVGPGTPVDVTYPRTDKATWSKNLFITEGKFKAQQLSKATNAIVLSVQGVANWKDVIEEIEEIQKSNDNLISRIFVTYDADIAYKEQVNMNANNMSNALEEKFPSIPVLYCIWNPNDGKGIDDLIFNNKLSTVKTVKKKVYDTLYNLIQKNIKEQKIDYATLPDEAKLKIFIECIYNRI